MTQPGTSTTADPRRRGRSTVAVLAGFIAVVVLSLGTDQLLHVLAVYPPWGAPMHDPGLNLLALGYRIVYTIIGAYITAAMAPHAPMRHAIVLGLIGLVLSAVGALAAMTVDLGPGWYPIMLVVTAVPCAWVGGALFRARHAA